MQGQREHLSEVTYYVASGLIDIYTPAVQFLILCSNGDGGGGGGGGGSQRFKALTSACMHAVLCAHHPRQTYLGTTDLWSHAEPSVVPPVLRSFSHVAGGPVFLRQSQGMSCPCHSHSCDRFASVAPAAAGAPPLAFPPCPWHLCCLDAAWICFFSFYYSAPGNK